MNEFTYTRCVELIVNEEDYAKLYAFLLQHSDVNIVKKWLRKEFDPFIESYCKLRAPTQQEKDNGYGDYVKKLE